MINVLKKEVLLVPQSSGRVDKATTLNTYSHYYAHQSNISNEITDLLKKEEVNADTPLDIPTIN